ncbi:hypothetical protein FUT48_05255 [Pseudomonas sp. JG-B]|nr:hypothetical protein [Pseudomonas sp. BN606]MRK20059.1 hypothetical protein [Pseudomonas sp. JG-B]
MLPAPTLAERVILPAAWGGSYFFNRIGQKRPFRAEKINLSPFSSLFLVPFPPSRPLCESARAHVLASSVPTACRDLRNRDRARVFL